MKRNKGIVLKGVSLLLLFCCYKTGIMKLFSKLKKKTGAIILMYHSVADNSEMKFIDPQNHIIPEIFENQMIFLSKKRNVISLSKLIDTIQNGENPEPGTVVITFDDGYYDNLSIAAPILIKYGLPATFFLSTGYISRGEPQWIDQLYSIFKFRRMDSMEIENIQYDLKKPNDFTYCYQSYCDKLMVSNYFEREKIMNTLNDQLSSEYLSPKVTMTSEDVKKLLSISDNFEVGVHTHDHIDLTKISLENSFEELSTAIEEIIKWTGVVPRFFSFPYGRTSKKLEKQIEKMQFLAAFGGCGHECACNAETNIYDIQRVESDKVGLKFAIETWSYNSGFWRKLTSLL